MKFIEHSHKYTDENIEYTPVTYFLKSFQEFVDWKQIAAKKAKKEGKTTEALMAEWEKTKVDAASKGTAFHKLMEDSLITQKELTIEDNVLPIKHYEIFAGVKDDAEMLLDDNMVYLEKMIWSKKYKICGTADMVQVVKGKINVIDYKTNKKLDFESWKNPRTGKKKKLLRPVHDLDDCNFNIYQLQLNTYMYLLLQANRKLKMGKMTIHHVQYDEMGNQIGITQVPVKDLQRHVKSMLNQFKK